MNLYMDITRAKASGISFQNLSPFHLAHLEFFILYQQGGETHLAIVAIVSVKITCHRDCIVPGTERSGAEGRISGRARLFLCAGCEFEG